MEGTCGQRSKVSTSRIHEHDEQGCQVRLPLHRLCDRRLQWPYAATYVIQSAEL